MYKSYYDLKREPFALTPDSATLFLSETHKEGLAALKYGILSRKGFVLMTGGVGTGKTTLINALVKTLKPVIKVCVLSNPLLSSDEFFRFLALKFDLPYSDKATFLFDFSKFLEQCVAHREKILLIIDEAHVLTLDLLEEVRLLSNLTGDGLDVLSIFLVGQPELLDRLADERLLPLRQRISIRCRLDPFSLQDTVSYILFRLNRAGAGNMHLFSEKAIEVIHRTTQGNPRLINILCDNALLSGFSAGKLIIDESIIFECAQELSLGQDQPSSKFFNDRRRTKKKAAAILIVVFLLLTAVLVVFSHRIGFKFL